MAAMWEGRETGMGPKATLAAIAFSEWVGVARQVLPSTLLSLTRPAG